QLQQSSNIDQNLGNLFLVHESNMKRRVPSVECRVSSAECRGLSGHEADDLLFAKTNFTKAGLNFRRGTQLLDSHYHACFHPVQGAGLALGLRSISPKSGLANVHTADVSNSVPWLPHPPSTAASRKAQPAYGRGSASSACCLWKLSFSNSVTDPFSIIRSQRARSCSRLC